MSATETFTMYSTTWCPFCNRLRQDIADAGIDYTEIDVDDDVAGGEIVKGINNGNRVVPTLVFPDGSSLTNPSIHEVKDKLAAATA